MKAVHVMVLALLALTMTGCSLLCGDSGKVVVDGFELPPESKETEWPGIISIFTRGGAYAGGKYLLAVKEAGFGAYHAEPANNEELRKHGVKLFMWGQDSGERAAKLADDDNVLGYWARYPTEPKEWETLGKLEKKLRKIAPNHLQFYAFESTWGEPAHYIKAIKPRVMWYRHYLWEGHHLSDDFKGAGWAPQNEFIYLERARKAALEAGIPIVRWVHAHEPIKVRRTVSLSLVYGIRGFTWWQGWTFFVLHKTDKNGFPILGDTGEEVAKLNQMMKAYSPIFKKARCVAAGHSWPWPLGYGTLPKHWTALGGAHVTAGLFVDREANTYFVVGNRRIKEPSTAIFTFSRPIDTVVIMDKQTGKWKPVPTEKDDFGKDIVKVKIAEASVEMIWVKPTPDRYRAPAFGDGPKTFGGTTVCKLTPPVRDGVIRYTLDGPAPTKASPVYEKPLNISRSVTVRARFFHNDGRASRVSEAAFTKVEAVKPDATLKPGLAMQVYEGAWTKLPDFETLKPAASGQATQVRIPKAYVGKDQFGLVFTGLIRVPKSGTYTFYTASDDGSKLFIGTGEVVNNDGGHATVEKSGKVFLEPGLYPIRVEFFEGGGGESLSASYEGPGISKQEIPAAALLRE